uniref:Uncharacterized protein n=1 Tax=uncultured marine virus TaxID=186617 RepID=A0A0F7L571_9VIRU|nr:hypothetical protein [uncultured marine virus]
MVQEDGSHRYGPRTGWAWWCVCRPPATVDSCRAESRRNALSFPRHPSPAEEHRSSPVPVSMYVLFRGARHASPVIASW